MALRLTLLLLICFLLAPTADLPAADWGTVMTPTRPLNIRAGRSVNTDRVTTIMPGHKVRADFSDGEWIAVFPLDVARRDEQAAMGYVNQKYLERASVDGGVSWGSLRAPKGMLNVRKDRSRTSEHVVTLQAGQVVRVDFLKDEWFAVFKPETTVRDESRAMGYSRAKYLFPASREQLLAAGLLPTGEAAAPSPKPAAKPAPKRSAAPGAPDAASWGKIVQLKRRANVRAERTANSPLVTTLDTGESVRVDFLERGWYAVFRMSEQRRGLEHALGFIYAPLLNQPSGALTVRSLTAQTPTSKPDAPEPATPEPDDQGNPLLRPRSAEPAPAEPSRPRAEPVEEDGRQRMVVTPSHSAETPGKGPVPRADQVRHGYRFSILDRDVSSSAAIGRVLVKVYLDVSVVPAEDSLRDFATTLYREEMGDAKELLLLFYLPGQDTKDLAFAEGRFSRQGLEEFWVRRATLYGTGLL